MQRSKTRNTPSFWQLSATALADFSHQSLISIPSTGILNNCTVYFQ